MSRIGFIVTRKAIIEKFAQQIVTLQRKADIWFYERNNQNHSSWLLDQVEAVKDLAIELGICDEVYKRAYEIYDFRNSGKKGYTLKYGKIVKCNSDDKTAEHNTES